MAAPYCLQKLTGVTMSLKITRLPSNVDDPFWIKPIVDGMNEKEIRSFFRKYEDHWYLHCGCELETALICAYLWKMSKPLYSPTKKIFEPMGVPPEPRDRVYFKAILDAFEVTLDDLYLYDRKGVRRHLGNATPGVIAFYKHFGIPLPKEPPPPKPARTFEYHEVDDDVQMAVMSQEGPVQFSDNE